MNVLHREHQYCLQNSPYQGVISWGDKENLFYDLPQKDILWADVRYSRKAWWEGLVFGNYTSSYQGYSDFFFPLPQIFYLTYLAFERFMTEYIFMFMCRFWLQKCFRPGMFSLLGEGGWGRMAWVIKTVVVVSSCRG